MIETKQRKDETSVYHKWICVDILIDYIQMQVSIMDKNVGKKNYIFCWRWLWYEQWWYKILEAIQVAMKYGFDKLRERQEANEKEEIEKIIEIDQALESNQK